MISRGSLTGLVAFTAVSAVAYLAVAAWLGVPLLLLNTDEAAVPPRLQVPAGVDVVRDRIGCASGGCWRDLELRPPPGRSADDVAEELRVDHEGCEPLSWLDRRRVCTGVEVVGGVARVSQRYDPAQVL